MKKLVETVMENRSTGEFFLFRISCGNCGLEYGNKPVRFSKASDPPNTPNKQILYSALYEQEFRDARHAAIRTASEHMTTAPYVSGWSVTSVL